MNIFENVTNGFAGFAERVDAKKPEIFLGLGITLLVGAGVKACQSTLHASDIIKAHKDEMDAIRTIKESDEYGEEQKALVPKLKTNQCIRTTVEFVKLYAPSVIVATIGVGFILSSHKMMSDRNLALSTALSATNVAFNEYRDRVRREVGDEVEQMIFDGGHREKVEVEEVDEKGKVKKHEEEVVVYDDRPATPYSILFDGKSSWWREGCPAANKQVVTTTQETANQLLRNRSVTLKEVIEMLGFEIDMEKDPNAYIYANYGWRCPREDEPMKFINFDLNSKRLSEFGKTEDSAWLVFNVDPLPLWQGAKSTMSLVSKE